MLYQVRSHGQLCQAKKYLKNLDIVHFVDKIVRKTENYRKTLSPEEAKRLKYGMRVTKDELIESLEITRIDDKEIPNYLEVLGKEIEIRNPIDIAELEQEKKAEARANRLALLHRV